MKLIALALLLGMPAPEAPPYTPLPGAPVVAVACCKVCSTGQACGDTCISRSKRCRKGPGCACDG